MPHGVLLSLHISPQMCDAYTSDHALNRDLVGRSAYARFPSLQDPADALCPEKRSLFAAIKCAGTRRHPGRIHRHAPLDQGGCYHSHVTAAGGLVRNKCRRWYSLVISRRALPIRLQAAATWKKK